MPAKIVMPVDLFAGCANAGDVLDGALVIEAVGKSKILGVVGDGHVFVAALPGGLGHLFDGVAPVGFDGVHVDIALQIFLCDQLRERMILREVDFAEILAHFGRDVVEFQLGVNFFFCLPCNRFLAFERGEAVFVERVSHLECALAQGDVVRL